MVRRYGRRRCSAFGRVLGCAALLFAFTGAVPLAFAQEDAEGGSPGSDEPLEAVDDAASIKGAFKLGDVTVTCSLNESDSASSEQFVIGEASERAYLMTNEGDRAYVRIASSLSYGDLRVANELGVSDAVARLSDGAEDEASAPAWRLAEDGWWYRSEPLEAGQTIEVHVLMKVPFEEAWIDAMNTGAASAVEASVRLEAVQARNMAISWNTDKPWGDIEVEIPAKNDTVSDDSEKHRGEEEEADNA